MRACVMFARMPLEGGGYKYFKVGFDWYFNLCVGRGKREEKTKILERKAAIGCLKDDTPLHGL